MTTQKQATILESIRKWQINVKRQTAHQIKWICARRFT